MPGYTAIVAADGELVVGAASMALYDEVTPDMVLEGIIGDGPLVIDANFPESALRRQSARHSRRHVLCSPRRPLWQRSGVWQAASHGLTRLS